MGKMIENHITFELFECAGLNEKSDMTNALKAIVSHDIVLATHEKERRKPPQTLPYYGGVEKYVDENMQLVPLVDGDNVLINLRRGPYHLSGAGLIKQQNDSDNWQSFSFVLDMFGRKFNIVKGSLITTENNIDTYVNLFLRIAESIYNISSPTYGIVDYAFSSGGEVFEDVPARKSTIMHWANFFGPDYTMKYGKEYFLTAPTWKKKELPDGGVFVQLNDNLQPPKDYVKLEEVKNYFSPIGVEYVSWPNRNLYHW